PAAGRLPRRRAAARPGPVAAEDRLAGGVRAAERAAGRAAGRDLTRERTAVDISADRAKLHNRLKDLAARWEEVKSVWDDSVRRAFGGRPWRGQEVVVVAALGAMDQLAAVMAQARHDCS